MSSTGQPLWQHQSCVIHHWQGSSRETQQYYKYNHLSSLLAFAPLLPCRLPAAAVTARQAGTVLDLTVPRPPKIGKLDIDEAGVGTRAPTFTTAKEIMHVKIAYIPIPGSTRYHHTCHLRDRRPSHVWVVHETRRY